MINTCPKIGDIILIDFDLQIGVETAKRRPALVVSREFFSYRTNLVWVCPISSTIKEYPTNIRLDSSTKTQGEIKVSQLRVLDFKLREWSFLEKAPPRISMQVKNIIDAITNLDDEKAYQ